jgi:undecaprenyl-diphosphatase
MVFNMDFIQAIILAIIEGITEYLPVSSTGHMIAASHLMGMPQTEFLKTFEIAIQLGAIAAVAGLYWRVFLLDWEIDLKIACAFVPTAIIGFVLYKIIKKFLLGNVLVVAWALFAGGVVLILFERFYRFIGTPVKRLQDISYTQALGIGLCQSLAVVPGVSRSAATIIGGLAAGVERSVIVEFSFLLAVPTMFAAAALDLLKTEAILATQEWGILAVGFGVAFIVAWFSVKFFLQYVRKHDLVAFGVYRVVAAVLLLSFLR